MRLIIEDHEECDCDDIIKSAIASRPKKPIHKAQQQMLDYWDNKWFEMIEAIKKDIDEVLS
jgi:hypothetical protein